MKRTLLLLLALLCKRTGKVYRKIMIPLLVPLFVSAFRRANDLAMAMEARCYRGGAGRTKMKPLKYANIDYRAYAIVILYFVIMMVLRFAL